MCITSHSVSERVAVDDWYRWASEVSSSLLSHPLSCLVGFVRLWNRPFVNMNTIANKVNHSISKRPWFCQVKLFLDQHLVGPGTWFLSPNPNNKSLKIRWKQLADKNAVQASNPLSICSKIFRDLNVALLSHILQLTVVLLQNPLNYTTEESPKLLNWSLMGIVQIFPPDFSITAVFHLCLLGYHSYKPLAHQRDGTPPSMKLSDVKQSS